MLQKEFDEKREQEISKYEIGNWRHNLCKHSSPNLPFSFLPYEQPNCFFARLDLADHKFIESFLHQIQNLYPDLKSEI